MTVIANAVDGAPETRSVDLVWTEVGPGLWVAKCGANFAGLIEKLWGAGYRATDRAGHVIGEFASLSSAQRNVMA
jgi:hypothetical protein